MSNIQLKSWSSVLMACGLMCTTHAVAGMFPHESKGEAIWQFDAQGAFYSQSNNIFNLNSYGSIGEDTLVLNDDPKDAWGFTFSLGYVLPSHHNDIRAEGTFLDSDNHFTLDGEPISYGADFDEGEVTVGNYFSFSKRFMARVGFGVMYASLRQDFVGAGDSDAGLANIEVSNKFWGIGPKLTLDTQFDIDRNWSIVADIGAGLPIGEFETSLNTSSGNLYDEETLVAFEFDGALGIRFAHMLSDNLSMDIEAGYLANIYLNAFQQTDFSVTRPDDEGGALYIAGNTPTDYFNYGPFVTIGVDFM